MKIIRMTIITGNDESSKTTESLVDDGSDCKMSYYSDSSDSNMSRSNDVYSHQGLSYGWSEGMSGSL